MKLESINKEITFSMYTRAIARQVSEKMLEGVAVRTIEGVQNIDMPATNNDKSEELLVKLMTGLDQSEIDSLDNTEYENLKLEIQKIIEGKKK